MAITKENSYRPDCAFSALLLFTLGWVILEMLLFEGRARASAHVVVLAFGCVICGFSLHICRSWWTRLEDGAIGPTVSSAGTIYRTAFSCLALGAIGGTIGLVTNIGSCFLLVLFAGGLCFAPWSRMTFCRTHMYVAGAILILSAEASRYVRPRRIWVKSSRALSVKPREENSC